MATTITFHLVYTPDTPPEGKPEGTVVLDVQDVFTMNDDDSVKMLGAFQEMFTQRARAGMINPANGQPLRPGKPVYVPSADECVHLASVQLWNVLKSATDRFIVQQATAQATANLPTINAVQSSQTNVNAVPNPQA